MTRDRAPRPDRPKPLVAILVVGIALGGMGFGSSLLGLAHLLLRGSHAEQGPLPLGGASDELLTLMLELGGAVEAAMSPWRAMMAAEATLGLLACVLLLVGAIRALRLREDGRRVFLASLVAGAATGIFRVSLGLKVNMAVQQGMVDALLETTQQAGASAVQVAPLVEELGRGVTLVLVGLSATWLVVELVYFAVAAWYLTRPETRSFYSAPAD